jgi:hypothetical protein
MVVASSECLRKAQQSSATSFRHRLQNHLFAPRANNSTSDAVFCFELGAAT